MNSINYATYGWVNTADAQDIFDRVARHLLHQNRKSIAEDGSQCVYRNVEEDLVCAAGCLIDPILYRADLEGSNWRSLVKDRRVSSNFNDLILQLQFIHDSYSPDEWAVRLKHLAKQNDLTWSI